mmetsp:Transcript_15189/g.35558  ORF Transcript_15189/g.35558 Transcript_15189/m.35558 type:complete len:306 (+) Transcript_15189:485-1402(+)
MTVLPNRRHASNSWTYSDLPRWRECAQSLQLLVVHECSWLQRQPGPIEDLALLGHASSNDFDVPGVDGHALLQVDRLDLTGQLLLKLETRLLCGLEFRESCLSLLPKAVKTRLQNVASCLKQLADSRQALDDIGGPWDHKILCGQQISRLHKRTCLNSDSALVGHEMRMATPQCYPKGRAACVPLFGFLYQKNLACNRCCFLLAKRLSCAQQCTQRHSGFRMARNPEAMVRVKDDNCTAVLPYPAGSHNVATTRTQQLQPWCWLQSNFVASRPVCWGAGHIEVLWNWVRPRAVLNRQRRPQWRML